MNWIHNISYFAARLLVNQTSVIKEQPTANFDIL